MGVGLAYINDPVLLDMSQEDVVSTPVDTKYVPFYLKLKDIINASPMILCIHSSGDPTAAIPASVYASSTAIYIQFIYRGALRQIIVNIASRVTYRITTTKLA